MWRTTGINVFSSPFTYMTDVKNLYIKLSFCIILCINNNKTFLYDMKKLGQTLKNEKFQFSTYGVVELSGSKQNKFKNSRGLIHMIHR